MFFIPMRVFAFRVFTSVTRSLGDKLVPHEGSPVKVTFLTESLEKVLSSALATMEHEDCKEITLVAGIYLFLH
jgi:hypothetical protein